jgi:CHRD domain
MNIVCQSGCMRNMILAFVSLGLVAWAQTAGPRTEEKFKARLSPVGIEAAKRAEITGSGSVSAVLAGTQLSMTGSFDGMQGPATLAQVHQGPATGVRGPTIGDLTVAHAPGGSIAGTLSLTAEQVESLRKGKLYIQIHSEKAPDGNLWGWLLR